jgi:hypothetical protein
MFNQLPGSPYKELLLTKNVIQKLNKQVYAPKTQAYYMKAKNDREQYKTLVKKIKTLAKQVKTRKSKVKQKQLEYNKRQLEYNKRKLEYNTQIKQMEKKQLEYNKRNKQLDNTLNRLQKKQKELTRKLKLCIGEPNKRFRGNEPSPKGVGYCAGNRQIGEIRIGRDNRLWIVKVTSNGSRRWQLYTPPPKLKQTINTMVGSMERTPGRLISYNMNTGMGL